MNEIAYPLTQIQKYSSRQIDKVGYYCSSILPPDRLESERKMQIYTWLRKLPQIQQQQVLSFTSYFRVHSILKMYKRDQKLLHEYIEYDRTNIAINVENDLEQYFYVRECIHTDNQQLITAQQFILDHTFISDIEWLYDTITLKGDIEELIKCFEILSKGKIFTLEPIIDEKDDEEEQKEYYEIEFQQESKQNTAFNLQKKKSKQNNGPCLLAEIIINEIEKAILIKFYQFVQKQTYIKEDQLFNYSLCHLNFDNINFDQQYQEFKKLFQTSDFKQTFIDEKLIRITWDRHIKHNTINIENIQQQIEPFLNNMTQLFQVPLKFTINESVLFCKYLVFKQLNQLFPLKKPPQENLKEEKKSIRKYEQFKLFEKSDQKQQNQLKQVNQIFTNNEKSKVLPPESNNKKEQNKKGQQDHDEQLQEFSADFVGKIFEKVIIELENYKQYKKKLKKAKNQKKSQATVEIIKVETNQNQNEQSDEWQDKPKASKRQKKKQMEKQRKKDQMERKKQKNDTSQTQTQVQQAQANEIDSSSSSKEDNDNDEQTLEEKQVNEELTQNFQQEIAPEPSLQKTASSDENEYFEVLNKKQQKKQNKSKQQKNKKQHNKKQKDIPDNQSLPDEQQYMPALKKNTSQSVQKNNNHQFEELKLQKTQSIQQTKLTLQKKETNSIVQIQRSGLVKSIVQQKEVQLFTYDIEKSQLQKMYKVILEQKITNDVKAIYKKEIDQFIKFKNAREIAVSRLQCVIKSYFKNAYAELFGSSITGLALKDSDVDMVVYGLTAFTKQQLYDPMSRFIEVLKEMRWVVQCKHIFQATVPLIKVLVDPSIDFMSFRRDPKSFILQYQNLDLNLKNGDSNQLIQIDITFELVAPQYMGFTYSQAYNIGMQSTDYTLQICQKINGFSECAIYLKKLLRTNDLNDSYTGGISSFCLTIMLAAIGYDSSVGQKLINFLHKYGCNFDPNKWGIYLDDKGQNNFYNIEDEPSNQPLTIISPISLEQIKINVIKIQTILQLFKQLYIEIMQNMDQIEPSLQKKINQKELLEYFNNHQIDKLVELVQWQSPNLLESHVQ